MPESCTHYAAAEATGNADGYCGEAQTRRYAIGRRCVIHAPGANEVTCPHRIAWTDDCRQCRQARDERRKAERQARKGHKK